jgi:thioredoxin-related protein
MKKTIGLIISILFTLVVFADNKEGIRFEEGTWAQITAMAKSANKLIFIDCHTSWCGPCKRLSAEIFTLKEVGAYFNANFINYKVDMEKGEGVELQKKFHVGAYPTLLWVDASGNVIHRALGFKKADELLAEAKKAMKGGEKYNAQLEDLYNKNMNDPEIVKRYLNSLLATSDSRSIYIAQRYLSLIPKEEYLLKENFSLIESKIRSPFSPVITYIRENREKFDAQFKKGNVDNVINAKYGKYADSLVWKVKEGKEFDEASFGKLISLMEERNYEKRGEIIENSRIKVLQYQKKWVEYANKINSLIASGFYKDIDVNTYTNWFKPILESDCNNKEVLKSALVWIEKAYEKNDSFSMHTYQTYWEAKINLMERLQSDKAQLDITKAELDLIKQFQKKQEIFSKEQTRRLLMINNMMK